MKIFIIHISFSLLFILAGFAHSEDDASRGIIREVRIAGEDQAHADQIKRIIPLEVGDELTVTNMARAASILKKTGLYKNITILYEYAEDNSGVIVDIELEPQRFVRRVRFKGAFPVFETELRNTVRIREGVAYDTAVVEEDVKRLHNFLQGEGYFESEVDYDVESDLKTGDAIVTFSIRKKGTRYIVRKVVAQGNDSVSDRSINWTVRKIIPLRYRKEMIDKAIDAVLDKYHQEGFYEAKVKLGNIEIDSAIRAVTIPIVIEEGDRTKVDIKGNLYITDSRIRKELTFVDMMTVDSYEVIASSGKIVELYHSSGFRNAKVSWKYEEKKAEGNRKLKLIEYSIEEGPRVKVKKVRFIGAKAFPEKKLKKQIITGRNRSFGRASLLVDKVLDEDIEALKAFYRSWGYEDVQITADKVRIVSNGKKAKVRIIINEGLPTIVREVSFEGAEFFMPDGKPILSKIQLIEGAAFDPAVLAVDKRKLLVLYADYGFPYVKVSQKVVPLGQDENEKKAAIRYSVIEGDRVEIGETIIRGNYKTRGRVFTRELELNSGEPFSYTGLLESRRNLRSLPFLYSAKLETLGFEENMDIVHLLISVRERPVRTIDFGVGYDSDLGPNAWTELGTLNLLGYGKTGRVLLMGGGDITRAELQYIDPRFLGSKFQANSLINWGYEIHPFFNLTQVAGTFALNKKFQYHITGTAAARMAWNRLSNVKIENIEEINIEENTLMGIGPVLLYDTRDDFIDPSRGWFNRVSAEYVEEFVNNNRFVKTEGQASNFLPITGRVILASNITIGHIEPLGPSLVPLQEVYFVGGNRTVRGFSEDGLGPHIPDGTAIGGLDRIVTNLELRFPIWSFVNGVVFWDSGQLVTSLNEIDPENQMHTIGVGMRLMTPVGPVRLDWGYKLEPVWWENRTRWHFSFGYPF